MASLPEMTVKIELVCPYPVIKSSNLCCGDNPCSLDWWRPCDRFGGCPDRSMCGGCDEPISFKTKYMLLAKVLCRMQGIDPDDVISDAGHEAWELVGYETAKQEWHDHD